QNHRPAAIFFVEFVGSQEMAAAKEQRIFTTVQRRPRGASNPIAQLIASNGQEDARQKQPAKRNQVLACENAGSDEQRIARQKEPNEKACLHKNDGANECGAAPTDQLLNSLGVVERAEEVKDSLQQAASDLTGTGIRISARTRSFAIASHPIR